jgi:predicted hotdog family 3-hydroxylacyl-ACP dehydratase
MSANTAIDKYLPHRPPMRLIDSVVITNGKLLHCETHITENNIFYDPVICGVNSWLGIELMAQTASIFLYFQNPQMKLQAGLLLGVRNFSCEELFFKKDNILLTTAENIYSQEEFSVFDCTIKSNNKIIASARLNTAQNKKS